MIGFQVLITKTKKGKTTKLTYMSPGGVVIIEYVKRFNSWTLRSNGETSHMAPSQAAQVFKQVDNRVKALYA